jgi:hypothetical protein
MNSSCTALGTPEAEERVRRDLDVILSAVRELLPPGSVRGVALTGGFGRGEGGMERTGGREIVPFNDYDFVVVTQSPVDATRLRSAAPLLATDIGIDFVDFGIFPGDILPRVPDTVFWYELREGHCVLEGPADLLLAIPPIDPARLPLEEATRLLVNRGLSLLWAWLHLEAAAASGAGLPEKERRFTVNSIHKAVLAVGDAALIRAGRYHLSYRERGRRIGDVALPFGKGNAAFLEAHAAATDFKLYPAIGEASPSQLRDWWAGVRGWHEIALRWIEESRFERPIGPWRNYPGRLAAESIRDGWRHPRRFLRERGADRIVKGWSRHFLDVERSNRARLPFLLYSPGPAGLDGSLLRSGLSGIPGEPAAALSRWREATLELLAEWHP